MINYWWVTRPKRKLNSVPEVLTAFAEISLNQEWEGQRDTHLSLEEALEEANLKEKVNGAIRQAAERVHIERGCRVLD